MTFKLIDFYIDKHSQSWINILTLGGTNLRRDFNLFYIQWTYDRKIEWLIVCGVRLI